MVSFWFLGSPAGEIPWVFACSSVRTSVGSVFLGICSLFFFSEILDSDRNPEIEKKWKKWPFQKKSFYLEMGKKGPKWAESRVLLSLPKVLLLIFGRRNLTKMKEINIFFFQCKSHIWGNSGSPAKKLLSNQIAESFDHQYLGK